MQFFDVKVIWTYRIGIITLLILTTCLGLLGVYLKLYASLRGPQRWDEQISAFKASDAKTRPPEGSILFVGSSSIRYWDSLADDMRPWTVVRRGFGGAMLSDVLFYSEDIVLPYKPKFIVLYAGDNDITWGKTPEMVENDFRAFVKLIRERLDSKTKILFLSIKPSPKRWRYWPTMQEANQRIETLCRQDDGLYYVDIASPMLSYGESSSNGPSSSLFGYDGVHMSDKGYELWTEVLRKVLSGLVNNT